VAGSDGGKRDIVAIDDAGSLPIDGSRTELVIGDREWENARLFAMTNHRSQIANHQSCVAHRTLLPSPKTTMPRRSWFNRFSKWASHATGHPLAFLCAVLTIVLWALTGPMFGFGDSWQLVINTGTTIVTFLMVFLIQNTHNLDSAAVQIKLDELIRAMEGAHNALMDLEELEEKDLEEMRQRYERLAAKAREALAKGDGDVDRPEF
jgi:low affinity Fe/Cu permease